MSNFYFGNGKVFLGNRNAEGRPTALKWVGNSPATDISLETETAELKESYSGNNTTVASVTRSNKATVSVTLSETSIDNIALALNGAALTTAAGSVANAEYGAVEVGEVVALKNPNITAGSLVVMDGLTALTKDVGYIENLRHGSIEMKVAAVDLIVSYDYGTTKQTAMFTQLPTNKFLRFEGVNIENGEAVVVELYKVKFKPLNQLSLIGDDFGSFVIEGEVLADDVQADAVFGKFGRYVKIA